MQDLVALGVKDSKLLTPGTRAHLVREIRTVASKVSVVEVEPREIDDVVLHGGKLRKLNFLEAKLMARVIAELAPEEVYVDASDVKKERYRETIVEFLPDELRRIRIVSENHADRT